MEVSDTGWPPLLACNLAMRFLYSACFFKATFISSSDTWPRLANSLSSNIFLIFSRCSPSGNLANSDSIRRSAALAAFSASNRALFLSAAILVLYSSCERRISMPRSMYHFFNSNCCESYCRRAVTRKSRCNRSLRRLVGMSLRAYLVGWNGAVIFAFFSKNLLTNWGARSSSKLRK